MNKGLTLLLIAGGAYVAYDFFLKPAAAAAAAGPVVTPTPPPGTAGTGSTTTPNPPASTPPAASAVVKSPGGVILPVPFQTATAAAVADQAYSSGYSPTVAQLLVAGAAAGGSNALSADQWNWYYSAYSGIPQTYEALSVPASQDRSTVMTVNGYMALRTSAGLSGVRGLYGAPRPAAGRYQATPSYMTSPGRSRQFGRF